MDDNEKQLREHRHLKDARLQIQFLELQLSGEIERLSHVEQLLYEGLTRNYFDEDICSAAWMAKVKSWCVRIERQRRDR